MKAGVLYAKDDIRYEDFPDPILKDDEVLVNVKAVGICGSDIPRVLDDRAHYYPIILGHEFSGVVKEIGKNVKSIKIGDHVAVAPLIPCFKCNDCQKGNYSQCKNYSFIGSRVQGGFAEYVAVPERNIIKFDSSISFEEGALFEPSTVALHGLYCADYHGGEDVAILGGGNIGLFTAQWAKIYGAKRVFVFDIDNVRLKLAKILGADITINTLDENYKEVVKELTNGNGFGFVFETAGNPVTMNIAFEIAGNKSSVCFIGTSTKDVTFPAKLFEYMNRKEFKLTGSWMSYSAPFPGKEWQLTSHFFSTGQLKFDEGLIFKKFPLPQIKEAFDMYKIPGQVKGKIMLVND
ncbi:galactitol-1-phosphate 5-dehydrogenase [Thermoanaerobacterium thermosaccharolyticum]|uniref:Zn-dependent alcohol dehydrogenase n=1 Tax=Thermoanaerobacterium thermosaccharolyticum TaxID=1517 RepID=A0A223HVQ5_THETR|nr:galactitol-1-phosphate 5-dehydrogenase [Thermoanaerobacterium thermosaccharolyticum]AST56522.1 Zn-dependent alcohol dehydrogenase [Thermoanaerobacterium thermosaccharolyticum]PHO08532.1 galactitol-1-phosphate 5-dehydrogenase [Thermoanaerobacterium thermosaccharolyticum]